MTKYRLREYNPIYEAGWIYVSDYIMNFEEAVYLANCRFIKLGLITLPVIV